MKGASRRLETRGPLRVLKMRSKKDATREICGCARSRRRSWKYGNAVDDKCLLDSDIPLAAELRLPARSPCHP